MYIDMNLTIDIGNTHIKAAVFENDLLVETFKSKRADMAFVESVFAAYPGINNAILACSGKGSPEVEQAVRERVGVFVHFDSSVKVPLKNLYSTPQTLGPDRLAAAVGANVVYPGSNVLIVDFGTAITVDMVGRHGEFLGGNISPGVDMRFRALHEFTSNLPLCAISEDISLVASSSQDAVCSGVVNGILFEIEGYLDRLGKEYDELKVIFTGGDGKYFAKRFKNTIFATYDLVVYGLNRILEYNAN